MSAVVVCFAEGGRRIATSGGPYGYIEAAFGPFAGFIAGTLLWIGNVLACGGVAAALGDAVSSTLPPIFTPVTRPAIIVATLGAIAAINSNGVSSGARFIGVATVVKLLPLLVFIVAGTISLQTTHLMMTNPVSAQGFGRAVILAVFAFTGMEIALSASGEIKQPARAIPRALAMAMIFVTMLYISIQLISQGMLGPALANSPAPLADAMGRLSSTLRVLLLVGASVSMFAWIGSDLLGSPRMLFAFGRDGLLPAWLGRVHSGTHAPYVAILAYAVIAALLALTGTFAELAVLATLSVAVLYLAGCAAVWVLASRTTAALDTARAPAWLTTAAAAGIASMMIVIALASWVEIGGLIAVIALSAFGYWLRRMAVPSESR
jgi:amino acid transporter